MDPKILDQLAEKLAAVLPEGIRELKHDAEKNFRSILQSAFIRMNLVTREEFDVQKSVLARTRAKLKELEERIKKIDTTPTP